MSFRDSRYLENTISSARDEARNLSEGGRSWLAQLMTVWASGYLEATCRDVLRTYAEQRAEPSVARFVSRNLDRFSSPKMENILTLVRSFDKNRADELEEFADGSVKESVNSIVGPTEPDRSWTPNKYICRALYRSILKTPRNSPENWKPFSTQQRKAENGGRKGKGS